MARGVVLIDGRYYWVKRVPKRYQGVVLGANGQPVPQVRQALHTDSRAEAEAKAAQVAAARLAEWEALLNGDRLSASRHYESAKSLAETRGFPYVPVENLAEARIAEIVARVLSVMPSDKLASRPIVEAVLGAVPEALPTLPEVLAKYYELTETRHVQKSERQKHRWKLPRERAVKNFLDVVAARDGRGQPVPMPVNHITRTDAIRFRDWWSGRIVKDKMKIESANKDFGHLAEILGTWSDLTNTEISNPFLKLRLDGKDERDVPPFSRAWVVDNLLAPGALDGMNEEQRDVLLVMVNTGLRPSEITDAPPEDFVLDAPIPYLRVAPHGRELKVAHTRRDIPLLGISLAAAKRLKALGAERRYFHNAGSWSAAANKFLKANGLRETPKHVAYSLRHYVEDELLEKGVDDRIRADILGHKYERPKYGTGGAIAGRAKALRKIAI